MYRLMTTILVAGLLSAAVGCCHHAAGVCDCVGPGDTCCYGHGPGSHIDPYGLAGAPPASYAPYSGAPVIQHAPVASAPVAPQRGVQWKTSKVQMTEPPVLGR